jgi:hypothetical protein
MFSFQQWRTQHQPVVDEVDLGVEDLAVEVEVVEDAGEDVVVVEAGVNLMIKRWANI